MSNIHINVFQNKEDTRVVPLKTSWENIVTFFTSPHEIVDDKFSVSLFSCVKYRDLTQIPDYSEDWIMDPVTSKSYVRRKQVNILENDCFVIDYDDTSTIKEVKERFKDYEYVLYTSHRHLYDGVTEKFRVIIPFTKPIPSWRERDEKGKVIDEGEWYKVRDSLKQLTGPCDPKSFDPNTIYNTPSCPETRKDVGFSEYHQGKTLDWTLLKKTENIVHSNTETEVYVKFDVETKEIDPDTILQTSDGDIKISEVTGKIEGVVCPNPEHNDVNGTEFVRRVEDTGNIFVHCKKCKTNFYMRRDDHPSKLETKKEYDNKDDLLEDLFEYSDEKIYEDSSDRDRVIQQLNDIKTIINDDVGYNRGGNTPVYTDLYLRKYKSHIIYMPEGSGKSRLVVEMAKEGGKIIFGCKSWEQVESKFDEYQSFGIKLGFNVKVLRSKEAKARKRFKTKLVRSEQRHPFSGSRILDEESIQEFINNNLDLSEEFIRLSWQFFTSDKLSFESIPRHDFNSEGELYSDDISPPFSDNNTRIILTTFEQLRIHKLKETHIPKDWTIWFDDPDIMDVVDIEQYDTDRWEELPDKDHERKTIEINGKLYFRRNYKQSLGYSLKDYKCIYTTTEIITRQGIESMLKNRKESYFVHDKMNNIDGGTVTLLGTEMVRKRYDGMIPLLSRRLTKKKFPTLLIADGLSTEINHSNNKGRNDLNNINLLVELSIPHPNQIRTICDSLGLVFKSNRSEITRSIILDKLHQSIGRNSGYRWEGYQSVVLVDKSVHKNIVENTRYKVDIDNSVIIDRTKDMSRKDTRLSTNVSPMVTEIDYLLNNINEYISDNRIIKPDINFVMDSIKDIQKKIEYVTRLIVSLSQLSNIEIKNGFTFATSLTPIQTKYWNIIEWILENHVSNNQQETVKNGVLKMLRDIN